MASEHWVQPFLEALRQTGNVSEACRRAGVSTTVVYNRRRTDADFDTAWAQADEDATDLLEAEAWRRAKDGVDEPVVYQGQLTPVWERDERGEVVLEAYETDARDADGKPVMAHRPKQLVIGGVPQWLTVNKRSDALLQFLLKGRRKRYATDRTEVTGADGAPLVDDSKRAARVAQLIEAAKARRAAGSAVGETGVDDLL